MFGTLGDNRSPGGSRGGGNGGGANRNSNQHTPSSSSTSGLKTGNNNNNKKPSNPSSAASSAIAPLATSSVTAPVAKSIIKAGDSLKKINQQIAASSTTTNNPTVVTSSSTSPSIDTALQISTSRFTQPLSAQTAAIFAIKRTKKGNSAVGISGSSSSDGGGGDTNTLSADLAQLTGVNDTRGGRGEEELQASEKERLIGASRRRVRQDDDDYVHHVDITDEEDKNEEAGENADVASDSSSDVGIADENDQNNNKKSGKSGTKQTTKQQRAGAKKGEGETLVQTRKRQKQTSDVSSGDDDEKKNKSNQTSSSTTTNKGIAAAGLDARFASDDLDEDEEAMGSGVTSSGDGQEQKSNKSIKSLHSVVASAAASGTVAIPGRNNNRGATSGFPVASSRVTGASGANSNTVGSITGALQGYAYTPSSVSASTLPTVSSSISSASSSDTTTRALHAWRTEPVWVLSLLFGEKRFTKECTVRCFTPTASSTPTNTKSTTTTKSTKCNKLIDTSSTPPVLIVRYRQERGSRSDSDNDFMEKTLNPLMISSIIADFSRHTLLFEFKAEMAPFPLNAGWSSTRGPSSRQSSSSSSSMVGIATSDALHFVQLLRILPVRNAEWKQSTQLNWKKHGKVISHSSPEISKHGAASGYREIVSFFEQVKTTNNTMVRLEQEFSERTANVTGTSTSMASYLTSSSSSSSTQQGSNKNNNDATSSTSFPANEGGKIDIEEDQQISQFEDGDSCDSGTAQKHEMQKAAAINTKPKEPTAAEKKALAMRQKIDFRRLYGEQVDGKTHLKYDNIAPTKASVSSQNNNTPNSSHYFGGASSSSSSLSRLGTPASRNTFLDKAIRVLTSDTSVESSVRLFTYPFLENENAGEGDDDDDDDDAVQLVSIRSSKTDSLKSGEHDSQTPGDSTTATGSNPNKTIFPRARYINITQGDLDRLEDKQFLNDTLIDWWNEYMYLRLTTGDEDRDRIHIFSTFLHKMLSEARVRCKGSETDKQRAMYKTVHAWTRGVDIFAKEFSFVPVNYGLHWSLAVIANAKIFHDRLSQADAYLRQFTKIPHPRASAGNKSNNSSSTSNSGSHNSAPVGTTIVDDDEIAAAAAAAATTVSDEANVSSSSSAFSLSKRNKDQKNTLTSSDALDSSSSTTTTPFDSTSTTPMNALTKMIDDAANAEEDDDTSAAAAAQDDDTEDEAEKAEQDEVAARIANANQEHDEATAGSGNGDDIDDDAADDDEEEGTRRRNSDNDDVAKHLDIADNDEILPTISSSSSARKSSSGDAAMNEKASNDTEEEQAAAYEENESSLASASSSSSSSSSQLRKFIPTSTQTTAAILFFDSLGCHSQQLVTKQLCAYLYQEWCAKKNGGQPLGGCTNPLEMFGDESYFINFVREILPSFAPRCTRQLNSWDCGVFVVKYIEGVIQHSRANTSINISSSGSGSGSSSSSSSTLISNNDDNDDDVNKNGSASVLHPSNLTPKKLGSLDLSSWFHFADVHLQRRIMKVTCQMCQPTTLGQGVNNKPSPMMSTLEALSVPHTGSRDFGDTEAYAIYEQACELLANERPDLDGKTKPPSTVRGGSSSSSSRAAGRRVSGGDDATPVDLTDDIHSSTTTTTTTTTTASSSKSSSQVSHPLPVRLPSISSLNNNNYNNNTSSLQRINSTKTAAEIAASSSSRKFAGGLSGAAIPSKAPTYPSSSSLLSESVFDHSPHQHAQAAAFDQTVVANSLSAVGNSKRYGGNGRAIIPPPPPPSSSSSSLLFTNGERKTRTTTTTSSFAMEEDIDANDEETNGLKTLTAAATNRHENRGNRISGSNFVGKSSPNKNAAMSATKLIQEDDEDDDDVEDDSDIGIVDSNTKTNEKNSVITASKRRQQLAITTTTTATSKIANNDNNAYDDDDDAIRAAIQKSLEDQQKSTTTTSTTATSMEENEKEDDSSARIGRPLAECSVLSVGDDNSSDAEGEGVQEDDSSSVSIRGSRGNGKGETRKKGTGK